MDPGTIAEIKKQTNLRESQFGERREGELHRRINLDPGYLSPAKLVLATTKDYDHRIYLGKGIYAEVTLRYTEFSYQPCKWTYPDYREESHLKIFNEIRAIYMQQLREEGV